MRLAIARKAINFYHPPILPPIFPPSRATAGVATNAIDNVGRGRWQESGGVVLLGVSRRSDGELKGLANGKRL